MSSSPDRDPIDHTSKFLWLFALIPVIFGAMNFFLPREMTDKLAPWQIALPFVVALLIVLIGFGVRRRIVAAAYAGIALFGAALLGIAYGALTGEGKRRGMLFLAILVYWPLKNLLDSLEAMRAAPGKPAP